MFSTIIGLALVLFGTIGFYVVSHGHIPALVQPLALLGIILGVFGASVLGFGFGAVMNALLTVRLFFTENPANLALGKSARVISYAVKSTYLVGICVFLLCAIMTLGSITGPLEQIGQYVANCICSLIYAILLAELFLRPLGARVESALASQKLERRTRS